MKDIAVIILAAGEGTRMKSSLPKVLHPICGKPMLAYLVDTIKSLGINDVIAVVGHKADLVKKSVSGVKFVKQRRLLGTGDAVSEAKKLLLENKKIKSILVLCGDVPLITIATLKEIITMHKNTQSACTLLTAHMKNPTGYGRISRADNDDIKAIIEETEASIYEKVIEEVNVGIYCFDKSLVFQALDDINPNNKKKEYYLTDTIKILVKSNKKVNSVSSRDSDEFLGINTRSDLIKAGKIVRHRILDEIMQNGVTVIDPSNTYVEEGVTIDKDTVIYPYTFIEKGVKIGPKCTVGPFARLRTGTVLEEEVSVGNFAEIVRSHVGKYTKIKHKCYIGDTKIGKRVNIGAGTIVANYDGRLKHKTLIEDNAFIGTGSILVAPVKIGKGAITGAGSVVTKNKDVPAGKTVIGVPAKILKK